MSPKPGRRYAFRRNCSIFNRLGAGAIPANLFAFSFLRESPAIRYFIRAAVFRRSTLRDYPIFQGRQGKS